MPERWANMTPVPRSQTYHVAVVPWRGPHQRLLISEGYAVSVGVVPNGIAVVTPSGALFQVDVYECLDWALRRAQQLGWTPCPWGMRGSTDCATHGPQDCPGARCGHLGGG